MTLTLYFIPLSITLFSVFGFLSFQFKTAANRLKFHLRVGQECPGPRLFLFDGNSSRCRQCYITVSEMNRVPFGHTLLSIFFRLNFTQKNFFKILYIRTTLEHTYKSCLLASSFCFSSSLSVSSLAQTIQT